MSDSIFLTDGNGSITGLTSYGKTLTELNIPSKIGNEVIVRIGDKAFDYLTKFTKVVISYGIETIGNNAFDACTSLEEVVIPNSVTSIGDLAFGQCELRHLYIPYSVTTIGAKAFENGLAMGCTELTIPKSVTSIGVRAFNGCDMVEYIEFRHLSSDKLTIGEEAFWRGNNREYRTAIAVPDVNDIHAAIAGYDWAGSGHQNKRYVKSDKYLIRYATLSDIADTIREKTDSTEPIKADQFPEAIAGIESGGGGAKPDNIFAVQNNVLNGEIYFFPFVTGMTWAEYYESGLIPAVASANSDPYSTIMYDEYMGFTYWYYDYGNDALTYGYLKSASGWPDLSDVIHGYDEEIYFAEY